MVAGGQLDNPPKRLKSAKSLARAELLPGMGRVAAAAGVGCDGVAKVAGLGELYAAGKRAGWLSPVEAEENRSRSAKFRGGFAWGCCLDCREREEKGEGKALSFVGGSSGEMLSAVLKSVKPSSVPGDLKSAKLSPEKQRTDSQVNRIS